MPRRIGRRGAAPRITGIPVLGITAIAFLPAVAGPPAIPSAKLPYIALLVYSFNLIVLIVFGIWGFRIGSDGRDEGNGGGGRGPDPKPPPPPGGRELTDDFPAWEEQLGQPEHERAAADRRDKVSSGAPYGRG